MEDEFDESHLDGRAALEPDIDDAGSELSYSDTESSTEDEGTTTEIEGSDNPNEEDEGAEEPGPLVIHIVTN